MKTILSLFLSCFLLSFVHSVTAQDTLRTNVKERADALTARLSRDLDLSGNQSQRLNPIMIKRSNDFKRIRETYGSDPQIRKDSIEEINWQARTSLKKVLTDDQFKLYDILREQTRHQKLLYQQKHPNKRKSEEDEELEF